MTQPTLAYVVDPRFPGGTSAAVAAELAVACRLGRVSLHAIESRMFAGRSVSPVLEERLMTLGLAPTWNSPVIGADRVILHNPSFLRFQDRLESRILCHDLVVVTHENFLRPGGEAAFDVATCLGQIEGASLCSRRWLAPVSPANRATVGDWLKGQANPAGWRLLPWDWFNICDFTPPPPRPGHVPQDRRGRLSRPGAEKFPSLDDLDRCFPPHAAANVILGGDRLLDAGRDRPHWRLLPFGSMPVADFFAGIDFMVYFTAPTWRESFGRVLAEAMGTGKVVLTDAATATPFGDGAIACTPAEVDGIIAGLTARSDLYAAQAARGVECLRAYSGAEFARRYSGFIAGGREIAA